MTFRDLLRIAWPKRDSYTRDVAYTFAANAFTAGLSVVSGILLARVLGAEGRGQLAAIQALPLIVAGVGMLGLQDGIVYFGARDKRRVGEYGVLATTLIFLFGVPIVTASWFVLPLFLHKHTEQVLFASRIYLLVLFLNALMGITIFTIRALHDMPLWNSLRVLPQLMWVLVILSLVAMGRATPTSVAMTYLVVFFLLGCVSLVAIRGPLRQGFSVNFSLAPAMLRYSLPLSMGSTPQVLGERTDLLIIAAMLTEKELGLYSVAASWSLMMLLPGAALFAAAFSKIAGMENPSAQWRFVRKATWASVAISIVAGIVLIAASPLIPWIFRPEFAAAVPSASVLVVAAGIRNVTRMLQVGLKGCGKPSGILYSEWGGVVTLVGTIVVLIPRYGLIGAAWSAVAAGVAASTIAFISLRNWAAAIKP